MIEEHSEDDHRDKPRANHASQSTGHDGKFPSGEIRYHGAPRQFHFSKDMVQMAQEYGF